MVKICGLTREQDVVAARDLGVWALGFVFAPSPRRLEPGAARRLLEAAGCSGAPVRQGRPLTVGVFTDAAVDEIVRVVDEVGLDAVQLHSAGGPRAGEVAVALQGRERATLIIQAVPVDTEERDAGRVRSALAKAARAGRRRTAGHQGRWRRREFRRQRRRPFAGRWPARSLQPMTSRLY